jgi:hypothetical protein
LDEEAEYRRAESFVIERSFSTTGMSLTTDMAMPGSLFQLSGITSVSVADQEALTCLCLSHERHRLIHVSQPLGHMRRALVVACISTTFGTHEEPSINVSLKSVRLIISSDL